MEAKRQASIVSPIPGTTRDVVEVVLNFAGYPVVLGYILFYNRNEKVIQQELETQVMQSNRRELQELKKGIYNHEQSLSKSTKSRFENIYV